MIPVINPVYLAIPTILNLEQTLNFDSILLKDIVVP